MQVQSAFTTAQNLSVSTSVANSHKPKASKKMPKEVKQLNRVNLRTFIVRQNGLFVSVDYIKLSGEKRTLTGRLGVKAFLKGGQNNVEKDERPYLTVFDIKLAQYRTVSLDTVSEIRAQGKIWQIID
jgi:hypothetical protein